MFAFFLTVISIEFVKSYLYPKQKLKEDFLITFSKKTIGLFFITPIRQIYLIPLLHPHNK